MRLGLDLEYLRQPNAVEDRRRLRASLELSDEIVIANVGRIVPVKNHDLLINAFEQIKRDDVVLLIVGGGPEEGRLRRRVLSAGMEKRIRFLGWRDDLALIYAGSDIVALSSNNEGTPVSLIEALAVGCPVVATDVGGVRDVLMGGQLGMLVRAGDVRAFTAALENAIENLPRLRNEAARRSAEVRERYSADRLRREIIELYTELLRNRAAEHKPQRVVNG
jgi:glycosyltransferase involved in cell wall biosynthesis